MYLIIAYHGKGRKEVEVDLNRLWHNFDAFVKLVKVKHVYYFQSAKDDEGADLLMIVEYRCARPCFKAPENPEASKQSLVTKNRKVNYWLYVRERKDKTS